MDLNVFLRKKDVLPVAPFSEAAASIVNNATKTSCYYILPSLSPGTEKEGDDDTNFVLVNDVSGKRVRPDKSSACLVCCRQLN